MKGSRAFRISALAIGLAALAGCERQDDMPAAGESSREGQTSERQVEIEQEGVTVPGDVMTQPEGAQPANPGQENPSQ